jgi:hypothetical protein
MNNANNGLKITQTAASLPEKIISSIQKNYSAADGGGLDII